MPTGESHYSLTFGTEVVLLPEVVFPTLRVDHFSAKALEAGLRENLDLVNELKVKRTLELFIIKRQLPDFIIGRYDPDQLEMVTWSSEKLKSVIPGTPAGNTPRDGRDCTTSCGVSERGLIP
ncbi:hypothetical protein BHE74_00042823 [Ensete ventricosum]|nr:hypothetical protein BHE74_00042823 [Ensete ventricosum]